MDAAALPGDHPLKPLEDRLLELCEDTHPSLRVLMGNSVAALRVFAAEHPRLTEAEERINDIHVGREYEPNAECEGVIDGR